MKLRTVEYIECWFGFSNEALAGKWLCYTGLILSKHHISLHVSRRPRGQNDKDEPLDPGPVRLEPNKSAENYYCGQPAALSYHARRSIQVGPP